MDIEISKMTKKAFKSLVKLRINELVFTKLKQIKMSQSKGKEIVYSEFAVQKYLKSDCLTTKQKSLLLNLRLRMTDVRTNYRDRYPGDLSCRTCGQVDIEESQSHLLECMTILNRCSELYNDRISQYEDIFGQIEKQVRIAKLFEAVFKTREQILNL